MSMYVWMSYTVQALSRDGWPWCYCGGCCMYDRHSPRHLAGAGRQGKPLARGALAACFLCREAQGQARDAGPGNAQPLREALRAAHDEGGERRIEGLGCHVQSASWIVDYVLVMHAQDRPTWPATPPIRVGVRLARGACGARIGTPLIVGDPTRCLLIARPRTVRSERTHSAPIHAPDALLAAGRY